jgi:hypothetical protein
MSNQQKTTLPAQHPHVFWKAHVFGPRVLGSERFCHVVVSAIVKPGHLVCNLILRCEENYRVVTLFVLSSCTT